MTAEGQEPNEPPTAPTESEPPRDGSTPGRAFAIAIAVVTAVVLGAAGMGAFVLLRGDGDASTMRVAPGGALDLSTVPGPMAAHYRYAAAHPSAYRQIPCFCGCEEALEHRSLLDCFVRAQRGWEAHAAGCAVCIQESEMLRSMLGEGASLAQIRAEIVARYTMES